MADCLRMIFFSSIAAFALLADLSAASVRLITPMPSAWRLAQHHLSFRQFLWTAERHFSVRDWLSLYRSALLVLIARLPRRSGFDSTSSSRHVFLILLDTFIGL